MAISTNDTILKFGTMDEVTSGTPATIATATYGKADQGATVNWTNDDEAPLGSAVLKAQFDTTMPTVGSIDLYAHLHNIQSTNDAPIPSATYPREYVGSFEIPDGVAADTDFFVCIPLFQMPQAGTAQRIDWYILNNVTGQTIGVSWQLWITPITHGPKA